MTNDQVKPYPDLSAPRPLPLACPLRNALLPGPIAHSLAFSDMPCIAHRCALYDADASRCSLHLLGKSLKEISAALHSTLTTIQNALPELLGL